MFEHIASQLLEKANKFLSFQFYILSGRFSIQYILDTYFESFIEQALTDTRGIGALLTACVEKIVEQGTYKADVTFLFCVYTLMRGCSLIDKTVEFEHLVDLLHGKKFKYVKPGDPGVTDSVTPDIFILQVDLLTSCVSGDLNSSQASSS